MLTLKGALHKEVREFPAQREAVASEKITRRNGLGAIIYEFLAHITQIEGYFIPQNRRISNSEGSKIFNFVLAHADHIEGCFTPSYKQVPIPWGEQQKGQKLTWNQ